MQSLPSPINLWQKIRATLSIAGLCGILLLCLGVGLYAESMRTYYFHPASDSLLSGMFAQCLHLNAAHLALNMAGLCSLALIAAYIRRLHLLVPVLLASAAAVCLGLQSETPPLAWYAGMSGALYGVWAWLSVELALQLHPQRSAILAWVACLAVGLKAGFDTGPIAWLGELPVAHQAHLYGFAGGLACSAGIVILRLCQRGTAHFRAR